MRNVTFMSLFQILLLFEITFAVFGSNSVFTDNLGSKISKSSEKAEPPVSTGQLIVLRSSATSLRIPDNFSLGIVSSIRLDDFALLKTVNVEIHIAHPRIGDLLVQLECPNGRVVTLHNRGGGRKKDLNAAYRVTECGNSQAAGNWKLRISDNAHLREVAC